MKSKRDLLHDLTDQNLSANQRAQARCQLAIQLETEGDYESAREAMGELWQGVGERPVLVGLDEETKGAVLLRTGGINRLAWGCQTDQWGAGISKEFDH